MAVRMGFAVHRSLPCQPFVGSWPKESACPGAREAKLLAHVSLTNEVELNGILPRVGQLQAGFSTLARRD